MEQRADDLDLHPLAERQVTHRLAHEILDVEQCDQLVSHCKEVFAPQAVDGTVQFEGVERRKIPLELVAVAHHECHLAQVVALPPPRHVAEDVRFAGGGMQQARQHLQGGRLAGAVRAEKPDHLARPDVEGNRVDRADLAPPATDDAAQRRGEAALALRDFEDPRQVGDVNDWFGQLRQS